MTDARTHHLLQNAVVWDTRGIVGESEVALCGARKHNSNGCCRLCCCLRRCSCRGRRCEDLITRGPAEPKRAQTQVVVRERGLDLSRSTKHQHVLAHTAGDICVALKPSFVYVVSGETTTASTARLGRCHAVSEVLVRADCCTEIERDVVFARLPNSIDPDVIATAASIGILWVRKRIETSCIVVARRQPTRSRGCSERGCWSRGRSGGRRCSGGGRRGLRRCDGSSQRRGGCGGGC